VRKHVVKEFEGGHVDGGDQEDAHPPCEKENTDCPKVEPVLCGEAAAQRLARPEMVVSVVALDGPRNLEGRRAQQADPSRILPSSGIIAFIASRQLSPVLPPEG